MIMIISETRISKNDEGLRAVLPAARRGSVFMDAKRRNVIFESKENTMPISI